MTTDQAPELSPLQAVRAAGFVVVTYLSTSEPRPDGSAADDWIPEDCINWQTHQFIRYRREGEGNFSFAGWEPSMNASAGGRYPTIAAALAWCAWIIRFRIDYGLDAAPPGHIPLPHA